MVMLLLGVPRFRARWTFVERNDVRETHELPEYRTRELLLSKAGAATTLFQPYLCGQGHQPMRTESSGHLGFDFAQAGSGFGSSLAAGDFDDDDIDDLVVGASGYDIDGKENAGMIAVFYGRQLGGLGAAGSQYFHHGT